MVSSGLGLNSWRCGFCVCWFHCQRCGAVLTCGTRDPSGDQSGAGAAVSVSSVRKVFGVLLTSRSAHSSSGWARQFTNPFLGPFSWAPPRLQPPQDSLSASLEKASPFPLSDQKVGPSCWPLCWLLLCLVSVCGGPNSRCSVLLLSDPSATPYLLESPCRCSDFLSRFYCERGWCTPVPSYPELELLNDC